MYRQIAIATFTAVAISSGVVSSANAGGGLGNDRCVHNYYSSHPCLSSIREWRTWAAEQGIAADRQSAQAFQAFAERNIAEGDRLLAEIKKTNTDQTAASQR